MRSIQCLLLTTALTFAIGCDNDSQVNEEAMERSAERNLKQAGNELKRAGDTVVNKAEALSERTEKSVEEMGDKAEHFGDRMAYKAEKAGNSLKMETRQALNNLEIEFEELQAQAKTLGINSRNEVEAARVEVVEAMNNFTRPDADMEDVGEELDEAVDHYRDAIKEAKVEMKG